MFEPLDVKVWEIIAAELYLCNCESRPEEKTKNLSVDTPQRKILFPKKQFLIQTFADTNIQSFPCLRMPNRHLAAETFSRPLL